MAVSEQSEPRTNYRCPSCGGGFPTWDRKLSYPITGNQHCPFCGLERGEYGGDREVHKLAIQGLTKMVKSIAKVLGNLDRGMRAHTQAAIAEHEREYHSEDDD